MEHFDTLKQCDITPWLHEKIPVQVTKMPASYMALVNLWNEWINEYDLSDAVTETVAGTL